MSEPDDAEWEATGTMVRGSYLLRNTSKYVKHNTLSRVESGINNAQPIDGLGSQVE
jgi:hypothetical protein